MKFQQREPYVPVTQQRSKQSNGFSRKSIAEGRVPLSGGCQRFDSFSGHQSSSDRSETLCDSGVTSRDRPAYSGVDE